MCVDECAYIFRNCLFFCFVIELLYSCVLPVCVLDVSVNQYAHVCVIFGAWLLLLLFHLLVCVQIIVAWVVFAMQLYVFCLLVCVFWCLTCVLVLSVV